MHAAEGVHKCHVMEHVLFTSRETSLRAHMCFLRVDISRYPNSASEPSLVILTIRIWEVATVVVCGAQDSDL